MPIHIAARIDKENCEYFDEKIRPLLDDSSAEYIGEVTVAEKSEFLSGAVALLDPADSPEPFGLAMIETIACGTPVIAFNRGLAPEIVDDGWTGFIVEDEKGATEAFDQPIRDGCWIREIISILRTEEPHFQAKAPRSRSSNK